MRFTSSVTNPTPVARGKLGVPLPHLGDDLAIAPLRRGVVPYERRIGERARVDVVGRAPDEAVRHALDEHVRLRVRKHDAVALERRRRRLGLGLLAWGDVLAERPLHEELPERVRDTTKVDAGILADRFERGVEEHVVVRIASEHTVGERDQPDGLVVRTVLEVRVQRYAQACVRLLRQHLAPRSGGQAAGTLPRSPGRSSGCR